MRLDNEYIIRYRTLPAASYTEVLSEHVIPYLPLCPTSGMGEGDGAHGAEYYLSTPMHYHPEVEILYVERGEWQYRTATHNGYRTAAEGDILFFSPYEPHEAAIRAGSGGYTTRCICFDTALLAAAPSEEGEGLSQGLNLGTRRLPMHIRSEEPECAPLCRAFSDMLNALDAPERCEELSFFGALYTMFGLLLRSGRITSEAGWDAETVIPAEKRFARAVIDYTEKHYAENLSTASAAQALSYSEAYFCRMFRRVFHMCYGDYCRRIRIAKVRPLLETMSVTDAAVACGFTHMSLFSKTFRRCTGMTPTEYKSLIRS